MDTDVKIQQLPLVNKAWNRACQNPASWRGIHVPSTRIFDAIDNNNTLIRLMPRLSRLEVLCSADTGLLDSVLSSVLEVCGPRLRKLCMDCTDRQLMNVAVGAPNLRSLDLMHTTRIYASGLALALPFLRQLRSIRLYTLYSVFALYEIDAYCPLLETYHGPVNNKLLAALASCEHLSEMYALGGQRHNKTTSAMADLLTSMGRNLRSIYFPYCNAPVVLPLVAQHCKKITKLDLRRLWYVTDALMEEVLSHCGPTLKDIALPTRCTDASLASVASYCPGLTALDLAGNRNITDDGVVALTASCANLRELDLRCTKLRYATIVAVVGHPALRRVAVSDWVTSEQMKEMHVRRSKLKLRCMIIAM
jgi:hypothetical protein